MEAKKKAEKKLQWHPAFYAGIQIELQDETENLIFENEHQLGTKPFGIDVLIIKKEGDQPIEKNIGRIFRQHNIIEYKSPKDYLSIDDFYKVYGYTCFYKADVKNADSIKVEELTITLVCRDYPKKLFMHLQKERKYEVLKAEEGIYYVTGDKIPIQILVTSQLSKEENLWLRSLTDRLEDTKDAQKLLEEYEKHRKSALHESIMDIIMQANPEKFKEAKGMCQALDELMKDEFDEKRREGEIRGRAIGEAIGEARGKAIGEARGKAKIAALNKLNQSLAQAGRVDDIIKAAGDAEYQERLLKEFGL